MCKDQLEPNTRLMDYCLDYIDFELLMVVNTYRKIIIWNTTLSLSYFFHAQVLNTALQSWNFSSLARLYISGWRESLGEEKSGEG